MPARSNPLQRMILLIEAALAPLGARIIESLMLRDLTTGERREIDIAIEIPTGPRIIRIALECRDHGRPASVQWIDEIIGKYLHLPIDRRVAVSRSGFTESARNKAKVYNIELLTPEQIPSFKWDRLSSFPHFVCIFTNKYQFSVLEMQPPLVTRRDLAHDEIINLPLRHESGDRSVLAELIHTFLSRTNVRAQMTKMWLERPGAELQFQLNLEGWRYLHAAGELAFHHAEIGLTGRVDELSIELRAITYAGETIAHGETTLEGQPVSLVVIEKANEEPKWVWYVTDNDKQFPWRPSIPMHVSGRQPRVSMLRKGAEGLEEVK